MESVPDDEPVWRALAHPMRRAILDVLREGPRGSGEIVDALGQGRHVVLQHLAVLRAAGLVTVEARGRRRINHLNPVPISQIYRRWVVRYEDNWMAALVGLKDTVERRPAANDAQDQEHDVG